MKNKSTKIFLLLLVIVFVVGFINHGYILNALRVYDNSIGMRGFKWGDSQYDVIEMLGDDYVIWGTEEHNVFEYYLSVPEELNFQGKGKKAPVFFYFDKYTKKLDIIDYRLLVETDESEEDKERVFSAFESTKEFLDKKYGKPAETYPKAVWYQKPFQSGTCLIIETFDRGYMGTSLSLHLSYFPKGQDYLLSDMLGF
jgi:hypothetical protein